MSRLKVVGVISFLILSLNLWGKDHYFDSESTLGLKWLFSYKGGYLVGNMGNNPIDYHKITHILVAGSAKTNESNQFFQSAVARGKKYLELYPTHQVVFISAPEVKKKENEEVFKEFHIRIEKNVEKKKLTGSRLVEEMLMFSSIASFDYYGHSSPWALILGKSKSALYEGSDRELMSQLAGHFTSLAAASLNGCNGGLKLAPFLSSQWKIPVSGALSGSLFERLHQDNLWYNEFIGGTETWALDNRISYAGSESCDDGTCWRMKPSPSPYSGYWGKFDYGMGFYKFFCNFIDVTHKCAKAAAKSLLSFPSVQEVSESSSIADFQKVVLDYLCPTGRGKKIYQECVERTVRSTFTGDRTYQPFAGKALPCSQQKCFYEMKCKGDNGDPKPGSCKILVDESRIVTTFIDEYLLLMSGFKAL